MAGRRLQRDVARQHVRVADQVRLSGLEDRQNAVGDVVAGPLQRCRSGRAPIIPFLLCNQVARIGKGRHQRPFSSRVFQPTWSTCRCVHKTTSMSSGATPADRSFEPRPVAVKARARALAAGVNQDGQAVPPDQECLDGDDQDAARRVLETRHKPGTVLIEMRCAVAEDFERRQGRSSYSTMRRSVDLPMSSAMELTSGAEHSNPDRGSRRHLFPAASRCGPRSD